MSIALGTIAAGLLLAWAGLAVGAPVVVLCGTICAVAGCTWLAMDGIDWLRERARVRRAAARNRLHWGPTGPGDQ
jgi:hypothetical protein